MRVLLVSTNRCREIMPCMPVGIACLLPHLDRHEVDVLDLLWEQDPEQALRDGIRSVNPEVVGLSVRNVDNQRWSLSEFYLPEVKRLVDLVHEEAHVPVVVGGAGYSIFPCTALNYLGAEWGIAGDGELGLPLLLDALEASRSPNGVPGLVRLGEHRDRFPPATSCRLRRHAGPDMGSSSH